MTTKPTLPIQTAVCPICRLPRAVYHDKTGAAYYARHQQSGKLRYCDKSGKKVTK